MKCICCEKLSISIICEKCQKNLLSPSFNKKEIEKGFFNYSFYTLSELEDLINSKYYFYGDRVYNILAKLTFYKFAQNFTFNEDLIAIPIDAHTRHKFSHTAILVKHLKSKTIKPKYNCLKAKNIVKYAGKDLEFRRKNPRNFEIAKEIQNQKVILCDDLLTTGSTILEAKKALEKRNNEVLFSITLANA